MKESFYTIGHSTLSIEEFVHALQTVGVDLVVDVRTVPRSRTNPQYNRDALPLSLAPFRVGYDHVAALGGLRGRSREVSPATNAFWQNESFHNYADHAMSTQFREGLARLRELGAIRSCALMCAEAVWWRCHRRIITDYLLDAGAAVFHIMGQGRIEPARMTEQARRLAPGVLVYPPAAGIRRVSV